MAWCRTLKCAICVRVHVSLHLGAMYQLRSMCVPLWMKYFRYGIWVRSYTQYCSIHTKSVLTTYIIHKKANSHQVFNMCPSRCILQPLWTEFHIIPRMSCLTSSPNTPPAAVHLKKYSITRASKWAEMLGARKSHNLSICILAVTFHFPFTKSV